MSMHPKSPVTAFDADGQPTFFARESVIRMASNYEISSMLKYANKKGEYDGMLHLVENGGPGLNRWDNAKLAQHWADISDEYHAMLETGDLVFDHEEPEVVSEEWPTETVVVEGKDGAELEIERNDLIMRLMITATAEAINSWEGFGASDFVDYTQLEGTRGFNNMTNDELVKEWSEARNSFYAKSFAGTLKHDIPEDDPEHDLLVTETYPGPA